MKLPLTRGTISGGFHFDVIADKRNTHCLMPMEPNLPTLNNAWKISHQFLGVYKDPSNYMNVMQPLFKFDTKTSQTSQINV